MNLRCSACSERYPLDTEHWRCTCGGVFITEGAPTFHPAGIDENERSIWRYRAALSFSLRPGQEPVSLGEGWTPLVPAQLDGHEVYLKLESLNPTGSFKDRGASVLVTLFKSQGASRLVEDSSGNAGAALAAYAARAGMAATLYVPAQASRAKQAQARAYGATLVPVEGPRENASAAAQAAVEESQGQAGIRYASHVYHPVTLHGVKTLAYELWEQLGGRAPARVVMPVGHGTLLLGCYLGFSDLLAAGLIEQMPRLYGVQAAGCAPLAQAFTASYNGLTQEQAANPLWGALPVGECETLAEGIRIARPVRGAAILEAVATAGGAIVAVDEASIAQAHTELARRGFYVEPSSAVTVAALDAAAGTSPAEPGETVLLLTGHGLKQPLI